MYLPKPIYPMVPAYAASLLDEAGHRVFWDDAIAEGLSYDQWLKRLAQTSPDLVFMETKTPVVKTHWKLIDQLRQTNPEVKFVLAGDHVTTLPLESMENSKIDFILCGGDYGFLLLNLNKYSDGEERARAEFRDEFGDPLGAVHIDMASYRLSKIVLYRHDPFLSMNINAYIVYLLFHLHYVCWLSCDTQLSARRAHFVKPHRRIAHSYQRMATSIVITSITSLVYTVGVRLYQNFFHTIIPGVDYYTALLLLMEIGDIRRFSNPKKLCCYSGLVPSLHQSGQSVRYGHITKQGNKWIRYVFEAIGHTIRHEADSEIHRMYERIKAGKGHNVAKVACARKLLKVIWFMLTRNEPYRYSDSRLIERKERRLDRKASKGY